MNIFDSIKNMRWRDLNIMDVVHGCYNAYLADIENPSISRDKIKQVMTYRLKICASCHMNNDNWCDNSGNRKIINVETGQEVIGCGCGLKCATALLSKECPAALWKGV